MLAQKRERAKTRTGPPPPHGAHQGHFALDGTLSTRCYVVDALRQSEVVSDVLTPTAVGDPAPRGDALAVQALVQAGAVVVAKTAMPTTVMQLDTRSAAFGQTLNAANVALSPGGLSGAGRRRRWRKAESLPPPPLAAYLSPEDEQNDKEYRPFRHAFDGAPIGPAARGQVR